MSKARRIAFLAMSLLAVCAFAQKIVFATGEWAPYVGEKLPAGGPSAEIVAAICKEAKIDYEFKWMPWARAESEVAAGNAYCTFPYLVTEERKKTYDYSEPFQKTRGVFFYVAGGKAKDLAWKTIKDFAGYTFGAVTAYWYVEDLKANGIKMETANSSDLAFKMLQAGRFDYIIEDELVGKGLVNAVFGADASKVKTLAKPYNESTFNLMVSRKYPNAAAITAKFNAGLAAVRKNGALAAILAKYGIKE